MKGIRRVLLMTYDCVRADVAYSGRLPGLEMLRRSGVTMLRAISSAPLTPISHATLFTGLQPYSHHLRHLFKEALPPSVETLAERFAEAGWTTGGVSSCPGLNSWYGFNRGFQYFDDKIPPLPSGENALESTDVQLRGLAMKRGSLVADLGIDWLQKRTADERWFFFLHFFDAHWPYEAPQLYGQPQNPYEGEVLYADAQAKRVLDFLKERGWLDDTLVVVFGDHGEDLDGCYPNDKGGASRGHPEEKGHGCLLYEQTQRVPLVFSHGGLTPGSVEQLVGLVDVAPTIANLVGLAPRVTDGHDITDALLSRHRADRRQFYAETMYPRELVESTGEFAHLRNLQALWLDEQFKVIRNFGDADSQVVFDLQQDPHELNPLPLSALPSKFGTLRWPV